MKNFDFLLNHDAGWASDSRSSAEVNLKKTSVKPCVLSRIGSLMSRQWKVVASIMLLLTLGVGQMWAEPWIWSNTEGGKKATKNVGDKLNNGSAWDYNFAVNGGWDDGWVKVYVGTSTSSYTAVDAGWVANWDGSSNKSVKANIGNVTLDKSGNWYAVGVYCPDGKNTAYTTTYQTWTSNTTFTMGSNGEPYWEVTPPAVKSGTISIEATNTAAGSGTGLSSESPIILISGFASTFTVTATQNVSDANSALWCKFCTNDYSSTTTYNIASGTTTTNQTLPLKVKYRNDGASLDGAETTETIYYKWAAAAPAIIMNSVTPSSSIVAGNDITLVGTRVNSSNTISFQYTTNDGSTWTDITPKTSSLSSNTLTATWTVPDAHGATQTFKFRAKLAEVTPIYSGNSSGVTVYNTKTIRVRNTNSWSNFYVYRYNSNSDYEQAWHGNTTGISSGSGQWKDVVMTSKYAYFIFNDNGSNQISGSNTYSYASSITDGGYYEIQEGTGTSLSFTSSSAPAAPTVTTDDATASSSTSATFGAHLTAVNRDKVTAYGVIYKQSDSNIASASDLAAASPSSQNLGTNINSGTANSTTTKTITAGKDWYYAAFATNGKGTSYGDIKKLRTTALTLNRNGGTTGSTSAVAIGGRAMPSITKPSKTGYNFGGYYIDSEFASTQYYNSSGASATNWKTNGSASETLYAKWTAKTSTVTLNVNGATSGSNQTITATYDAAMPSTDNSSKAIAKPSKTGYDFGGYYDTSASSGGTQYYSSANPPASVRTWNKDAASTSLWARWIPQTYTETNNINKNNSDGGGSTAGTYTATYMSNKITINTAPTRLGCHVEGYYKEADCTNKIADASGNLQANTAYTNASKQWNVTSSQTLFVKWEADWYVYGSTSDLGGWTTKWATGAMYYSAANTVQVTLPLTVATNYEFKIYKYDGSTATYWRNDEISSITGTVSSKKLSSSSGGNMTFTSSASGNYTFTLNIATPASPALTLTYPATVYTVNFAAESFYNDGASHATSTNGGTVTAVDGYSKTMATGNKVISGGSVTFTAAKKTGYTFDGWFSDAACTSAYTNGSGGATISGEGNTVLTLSSIGANKTVYAKFSEIMSTVTLGSLYGGEIYLDPADPSNLSGETPVADLTQIKVGKYTTHTIVAEADTAHYFKEWQLSTSPNFTISGSATNEDNINITVTGTGVSGYSSLHAYFEILESIYFRNIFDNGTDPATHWSKVFVFFDTSTDTGNENRAKTSANNSSKGLHVEMSAIGTTGIYRAYVPRYVTRNSISNVAFASYDMSGNNFTFWPGDGVANHGYASMRGDYNIKHNMFVPNHAKTTKTYGNTDYYNTGYWMHYTISAGANAGYWIERHTGTNTYSGKPSDQFVIVERAFDEHPSIRYRLRIDGMNKDQYAIFSEGGKKYKANATITYANCDNVPLVEDNGSDAYFTLTPTAEGEYIITIDQSGDSMRISVNYPVAVGDYVLENTYTGKTKTKPETDSTYVTRSNIIKSIDAATKTRYSMFLSNAGTATLKLRKCTAISLAGVPTWSEGTTTNLAAVLTAVGTKPGVYQFDLAVDVANNVVASEVDSLRLYTGDFYLKTDAAPGGWVAYKNNAMDKNTVNFDRTAKTFDNYWCHHYASQDANIKCVIANDYCNQLSDTMKADGIARIYEHEPFVPIDGTSIRFSYNSATNTIGRAYLGASSFNNYLNIVPNAAATVYDKSDVDLYNKTGDDLAKTKFADNGDFVYEIDVKVYPGAQAGVQAVYNSGDPQIFLPTTDTVLGGTKGKTKYDIRVVYDFKTNYMMSAFVLPEGEITDKLSNVDMLWVRHKEDSATQVLLGTGGELKNVRVIGALQFNYNEMCSNSTSGDKVDLSTWSPVSRPYLKYFVSFPFDVEMNSIFGLNQADYGLDYVIQKYNGTARAKEGLFMGDGDNYWENVQMGDTLFANEGYCVILDNDYARWDGTYDMWHNKSAGSSTFLYFPAMEEIESITNATCTTTVASHECKVDRTWAGSATKNHMQTDSHWNMIGSPLFHDSYIQSHEKADTFVLRSYYYLDYSENKWKAKAISLEPKFKAMSSRLVQWCGTITWTTNSANNAFTAPRRTNDETKNYLANIELSYNGKVADWAYVELLETASDEFILREDMYKLYNSGIPQIYTFAGDYDVAYNGVPVKNQTIPVGLLIRKNGTYTFSMPTNFSGTVTLIDTYAQTRTNLAFEDYEVYLEKGTINDRFYLEINIKTVVTSLENADGNNVLNDGGYHKFIRDDQMFILKNGVVYDAQGRMVE